MDILSKLVEIDTDSVVKTGYDQCASIIVEEAQRNALDVEIVDGEVGAKDGLSRPNVIVPMQSWETLIPVFPKSRFFIAFTLNYI